jgi:hypothetical protein
MLDPFLRKLAVMAPLMLSAAMPVSASWYIENVEKGSDIMMMDVRWPFWAESTYFANWNFAVESGFGGYGGFSAHVGIVPETQLPNLDSKIQEAIRPGSVWSLWGTDKKGETPHMEKTSPFVYPSESVGEGATLAMVGPAWPFMQAKHWYTMMMRVWAPAGVKDPQVSYLGRWVKDVDGKQWHLYGVLRLPAPVTFFQGNAGFLEDYGHAGRSVRALHRRLGYARKDGTWKPTNTASFTVPAFNGRQDLCWVVNTWPEDDHEVLAMELSSTPSLLPLQLHGKPLKDGTTHTFTVKQPAQPSLDKPHVREVKAQSNGKQVLVTWHVPESASPQLGYRVEIFDNPACTGEPRVVREERMPLVETALLDAEVRNPTVRLTLTDVFDQNTEPVVVQTTAALPPTAAIAGAVAPGLTYELLTKDTTRQENVLYSKVDPYRGANEAHYWVSLAELKDGKCIQRGVSRGFDTSLRGDRNSGYAFRFSGLLHAPTDGIYVLDMQAADGFQIRVDQQDVLTYDGIHGPNEKTMVLNLSQGNHALAVDYFVDMASPPFFKLSWQGPRIARQEIPVSALFHVAPQKPEPRIQILSTGGAAGAAEIQVRVEPNAHTIDKITLFLGTLQIAESKGNELAYKGPMPEGESPVWALVTFDKDNTMTSEVNTVKVTGPAPSDWKVGVAGNASARRGLWQTGADSFSFFGEGEYVLSKRSKGDFTLTCRIDNYAGKNGEPVNAMAFVGLTAREHAEKNNYGWGREVGVMQTVRYGLRTTPNTANYGGSRISNYPLPKDRPWLRVVRQGALWTAWTSVDGKTWEQAARHYKPTNNEMDAGVVFFAPLQNSRAYFQASVSHLELIPGLGEGVEPPLSATATNTSGPRLTGVVLADADANTVVARSSQHGLLRSTNGGESWSPINGNLSGLDNQVRSVAIHPQNPEIMLRASSGGLALTKDGGKLWTKLNFPGDFDGEGPSALCGEVVAFDPVQPNVVVAGCEAKGFFRSGDAGETWKLIGAQGERITAAVFCRAVRGTEQRGYLHVVTCPDLWMPLLGRGKPALSAPCAMARDYVSQDGGLSLQQTCERTDLGYLNLAFDKTYPSTIPYGTTHGLLYGIFDGNPNFLFMPTQNIAHFSPVTALNTSCNEGSEFGRCLTQALNPPEAGRLSRDEHCLDYWNWVKLAGDIPIGGMISLCGEYTRGKRWWLLATDGLYRSTDGGTTLKKILDEKGTPVK